MSSDTEFTLPAVFDTVAEVHPDRPCLIWGDVRVTFAEMADKEKHALSHRARAFRTLAKGVRVIQETEGR